MSDRFFVVPWSSCHADAYEWADCDCRQKDGCRMTPKPDTVTVPARGTFLVADGVVRRVANSFYDTEGRLSVETEKEGE
jgi:hypothetical protein